jgi:hypothetical protein
MKLTKIDVAQAHLITAVRAHFRGEHPASVYLLAASAREILTTIGEKTGTRTMLAGIAETTGTPLKNLAQIANERRQVAPSGEWNDDDFDVLADGAVVDRIFKANAAPVGSPWMWTLTALTQGARC